MASRAIGNQSDRARAHLGDFAPANVLCPVDSMDTKWREFANYILSSGGGTITALQLAMSRPDPRRAATVIAMPLRDYGGPQPPAPANLETDSSVSLRGYAIAVVAVALLSLAVAFLLQ